MTRLRAVLRARGVLVADGGWGTMLMRRGLALGECPERWCLDRPDEVRDVARQYVGAGAEVVMTNSFGANRLKLERFGLEAQAAELNEIAARLSREAAGPERFVFGSVGPTGRLLVVGEVTEAALAEAFGEQAAALVAGGVDAILVETMIDVEEARVAVRAARACAQVPVACTFTFERSAAGAYHTIMGVAPAAAARAALEAGADIVGTNCGRGVADMVAIVRTMRAAAPDVPILVQANAGLPDAAGVYPETPESMVAHVPALVRAGAGIVGGCCGTTPAHIRAIRRVVDRIREGR
ncbi:MAG: homocysteine S-methyltransferase family protein [Planctomycetes bacterium]|nr:homocysteine S-methyltransferase family protein [Planctomycetota bacterium]